MKNKPKSLVLKPNYPVAEKIANYPVVEAKSYPLSPKRDYPISPVKDYPITPVKDYPLTPVKDYPLTLVKDYPLTPVMDYPITARQDYPIAPVKEFPVVTDDFLKKLLLDGRAVDSSGSKVIIFDNSSSFFRVALRIFCLLTQARNVNYFFHKDSGVIDGSVDGESESTTSSLTSSQFHTGKANFQILFVVSKVALKEIQWVKALCTCLQI